MMLEQSGKVCVLPILIQTIKGLQINGRVPKNKLK